MKTLSVPPYSHLEAWVNPGVKLTNRLKNQLIQMGMAERESAELSVLVVRYRPPVIRECL